LKSTLKEELREEFEKKMKKLEKLNRSVDEKSKSKLSIDNNFDLIVKSEKNDGHRNHRIEKKFEELESVQNTLRSLKINLQKTKSHDKRIDRSFLELQRQITNLEHDQKNLERSHMKQTKHSEKILKEALSPKNKRAAGERACFVNRKIKERGTV
jgi:predicted  nucleic acid-binding Zn-ribbon protein